MNGAFRREIARARTFGFENQISAMRARGLAKGGSLENAVVVGENGVLNDGGLRFDDEFVRHKVLDCLGDLYLAGGRLVARVEAVRAGHALNNRVLRALFADPANWCFETEEKNIPARPRVSARAPARNDERESANREASANMRDALRYPCQSHPIMREVSSAFPAGMA